MAEPTTVDEEAGVLRSLLEEDPSDSRGLVDRATATSLLATSPPIEAHTMVVAHQHAAAAAAAHQARAAAALEQADAAEEQNHHHHHHQLAHHVVNATHLPQQQQHQVSHPALSHPEPTVRDVPRQQTAQPPIPITIPSATTTTTAHLEGELPLTPNTGDLVLSVVAPPPSICLCQQPARIPRPRNAFILFRQHNQAAVVAQNPGKPNPEISKIIGEMWRQCSQEIKDIWLKHADDEKRKHLERYPEYRYQPRRNGKKNAAAVAAAVSATTTGGALSPPLETAICRQCGGRTGTLSTPQTPATPASAVPKTPRLPLPLQDARTPVTARPPKRRRTGAEDNVSRASTGSSVGPVGEQAGVEALLQLGHLQAGDEGAAVPEPQSSTKRPKPSGSPQTAEVMASSPLQHNLYAAHFPQSHDPNIDPFLRQNGFDAEPHMTPLDPEGGLTAAAHHRHHQMSNFSLPPSDPYMAKPISVLEKIHAFNSICKPLLTCPGFSRMPIIAIEGDDTETVSELFHALVKEIRRSEPVDAIDEPDVFAPEMLGEETDIDGLLGGAGGLDSGEDVDAAIYLSHVATWRRKCVAIKKAVLAPNDGHSQAFLRVVILNRYMVSRSNAAGLKLSPDGLSPAQHWQWCATVWRGCLGPDMTIYVATVPGGNGVMSDEAVEVKEGGRVVFVRKEADESGGRKSWGEKIVRRLGFEVGEIVRSLKGFET